MNQDQREGSSYSSRLPRRVSETEGHGEQESDVLGVDPRRVSGNKTTPPLANPPPYRTVGASVRDTTAPWASTKRDRSHGALQRTNAGCPLRNDPRTPSLPAGIRTLSHLSQPSLGHSTGPHRAQQEVTRRSVEPLHPGCWLPRLEPMAAWQPQPIPPEGYSLHALVTHGPLGPNKRHSSIGRGECVSLGAVHAVRCACFYGHIDTKIQYS